MADIDVKLGDSAVQPGMQEPGEEVKQPEISKTFEITLKARKTLDGNIIVTDHADIDIILMPEKMKIITFAKNNFDDLVYEAQNRFFRYLFLKGVIVHDSVCGGNVYGSMEAKLQKPETPIPIDDVMLMIIFKFIQDEKPSSAYQKAIEDDYIDSLTDPDSDNSTELGDVPAAQEKGSVPIHQVRRYAYGL